MKIKALKKLISYSNQKVLIVDSVKFDPIEYILVVKDYFSIPSKWKDFDYVYDHYGNKRIIRVISCREIGMKCWWKAFLNNSNQDDDNCHIMSETDIELFFWFWVVVRMDTCWMKYNAFEVLGENDSVKLSERFIKYISDKHFPMSHSIKMAILNYQTTYYSRFQRFVFSINKDKAKHFIFGKMFRYRVKNDGRLTAGEYYKCITDEFGSDWKTIVSDEGKSNAIHIVNDNNGEPEYIKGNDLLLYGGIENEIRAQVELSKHKDASLILHMKKYDGKNRWICYPYLKTETLDSFLQSEKKLEDNDVSTLGQFLIECVDLLYSLRIVHNDLRPNNIMVLKPNEECGMHFLLFDFGCAYTNAIEPWDTCSIWGKYIATVACGKARYNDKIIDDAASAYLCYCQAGGTCSDKIALDIKNRIGRIYYRIK